MQDAWRAYLDLALGLTDTSRKKATKVVKKLVGRGGVTAEQLQSMAEELVSTSLANREALARMVRYELERTLGRVGLATTDEVNALTARVHELEQELTEARAAKVAVESVAVESVAEVAAPRKVAKKTVAKKVAPPPVDSTPVVPAPLEPVAGLDETVPAPVKKAPAKKVVAKKAATVPAKKTVAKKTVARKAPAKKATEQP